MITVNIDKAKEITHAARRAARSSEFAPLDIKATIPAEAAAAEEARAVIREKYAIIQESIDSCSTEEALLSVMKTLQNT